MKLTVRQERCKQCELCAFYCPKGALTVSEEINPMGYRAICVDHTLCITCGTCYTVCPDGVFQITNEL